MAQTLIGDTRPGPSDPGATPAAVNLLGLSRAQLTAFFESLGEKPYRATQVLKWIHQHGVVDFAAMTDLSRVLRARLAEMARLDLPEFVVEQHSEDGTRKWLARVDTRNAIETVYIPDGERGTLCISSQVGCALNCSFCATAQQGFNRNLSSAEIIAQLWYARNVLAAERAAGAPNPGITNVVLMGMGEPLLNLDNVIPALTLMLEDCAYGLGRRRVTLSTAGVVPGLARLKRECPVSLAVSLHAPDDALRDELVPVNRSFPIATLLDACREYLRGDSRQKITFEYVMLAGVNDSDAQARALGRLLRDVPAKVNLIPFNPFPAAPYQRSTPERIDRFRDLLVRAGLTTITRKTRGEDIAAACGQLAGQVVARSQRVRLRQAAAGAAPA